MQNRYFRKWFQNLVGAAHLPLQQCIVVWDHCLNNPPFVLNAPNLRQQHYNDAVQQFVDYFRNYWRIEPHCSLINQFENDGPRSTNFAEGYHRRLKGIFSSTHPTLAEFLHVMKGELRRHSFNAERVLLHNQRIKLRKPKYRQAEELYMQAKAAFRNGLVDHNNIEVK